MDIAEPYCACCEDSCECAGSFIGYRPVLLPGEEPE